ncbi:thioredoxin fold domain-containing protein [Aquamicrobium sp.]|uniref:thioredoxin fold domain-containing protein n=1 Tax=Aquamicrobium sp. TaxID=1872579 RepID=UPI00258B5AC9|nr:thioredoxin fold domain-containing protein [Aquamicrobium sp.]MCK9549281.1 thioredoxin fold domain-containing protein [Aquamicrobium sp.]
MNKTKLLALSLITAAALITTGCGKGGDSNTTESSTANPNMTLEQKIKALKPLTMPGLEIKTIQELDDGYYIKLKAPSQAGNRTIPAFVSKNLKYVTIGNVYDTSTGKMIGLVDMKSKESLAAFTLGNPGNGGKFYVFTDIDCPACRSMEKYMSENNLLASTQLFVYFYPLDQIHPESRLKSQYIMSFEPAQRAAVADKVKSGQDTNWKTYSPSKEVIDQMEEMKKIADELSIQGTPSFYDENGNALDNDIFIQYLMQVNIQQRVDNSQNKDSNLTGK